MLCSASILVQISDVKVNFVCVIGLVSLNPSPVSPCLSPVHAWIVCGFNADLSEEFGSVFKLFFILPVWIISLAPTSSSPRSINQKLFNLEACDERGL